MIEGTESDVHSTEESDDFVKQFHDDFLDKECVLVNLFCDLHHKNKSTLHFLIDQYLRDTDHINIKIAFQLI